MDPQSSTSNHPFLGSRFHNLLHSAIKHWCISSGWANYWDDFNPFLRCINDCPTCEFQPLTPDRWLANLKGVKKNSARGADGFSTFELQLVHGPLLHFLLDILSTIEKGAKWPDLWTQARVVVLSKGFEPKSPLDIRPISILPKIYRTWSRLRSLEVLRHIGSILPPQVAATAGGISADSLAAYTATVVEDAFWNREDKCGVVIDIIKCYNIMDTKRDVVGKTQNPPSVHYRTDVPVKKYSPILRYPRKLFTVLQCYHWDSRGVCIVRFLDGRVFFANLQSIPCDAPGHSTFVLCRQLGPDCQCPIADQTSHIHAFKNC